MDHCSLPNTVKIEVSQLTLGMYVVELDRPWTDTPFLFQRFRITHPEDLRQLQALCSFVWVDSKQSTNPVEQQIKNLVEPPHVEPAIAKVKFEQDVRNAEPIWKEARETWRPRKLSATPEPFGKVSPLCPITNSALKNALRSRSAR